MYYHHKQINTPCHTRSSCKTCVIVQQNNKFPFVRWVVYKLGRTHAFWCQVWRRQFNHRIQPSGSYRWMVYSQDSRNIFYSQVLRDNVTFLTLQDELILMLNREFYILKHAIILSKFVNISKSNKWHFPLNFTTCKGIRLQLIKALKIPQWNH